MSRPRPSAEIHPFPDVWRVRSPDPPHRSELNLLRDREGVVHLDAQVSDGTLQLAMAEKQLTGPEVAGLLVEQRNLGATKAVGAVSRGLQLDQPNPAIDQARVLARGQLTGYAYCTSLPGTKYEPKNGEKQALFEVDLTKLLPTLRGENPNVLGPGRSGFVAYTSVEYSEKDPDREPSPFVKDVRFEHEREVRLAFLPASGSPIQGLIDTPESEAVAACFKRLA